MTLAEYLEIQRGYAWADGVHDCCTFAADWLVARGEPDPMADLRGYASPEEAQALAQRVGGMVAGCDARLTWRRSETPSAGCVGLIRLPGEDGEPIEVGAIFSGRRWLFRTPRGIGAASIDPADVVATWAR